MYLCTHHHHHRQHDKYSGFELVSQILEINFIKMAQKNQNLNDYVNALSTPKAHFYREIARLTSRSVRTVERWCSLDSKTTDAKCLKVLEAKTKIRKDKLFVRH